MSSGRVSPEQAAVIVDAVDRLPTDPGVRERGETFLLDQATRLNATDLAKAARHLVEVADPDQAERKAERDLERQDRAAHHHRYLSIVEDGAGGIRLRGRGTVEDAAVLKAALLPLTKPQPAADPTPTPTASRPRTRGTTAPGSGTPWSRPASTPWPPTCPRTATARGPGSRSPPACRSSSSRSTGPPSAPPPTPPPTRAGDPTRTGGLTEDGLQLTPATVRRLACDADIIPIALGTSGEVLDVGRAHRLVTPAIWRALVCRDQHCTFPGCTRPPLMCHAHHIQHWVDGGETSLTNMVLLCGHHHRTLHHTPWQVRLNPHDGRPEFLPPEKPGAPPPTWIRSRPRRE